MLAMDFEHVGLINLTGAEAIRFGTVYGVLYMFLCGLGVAKRCIGLGQLSKLPVVIFGLTGFSLPDTTL